MAESVVRLRIESEEYEGRLRRASSALGRLSDEARAQGKSLASADQQTVSFVRSLGRMETQVRTASGKLGEMQKTFEDLAMQYKHLADAEKVSPYGQALKASLDELQERIRSHKADLDSVRASMSGLDAGGGALSNIAGKAKEMAGALGLNIPGLNGMTLGIGAVTTAAVAGAKALKDYVDETLELSNTISNYTGMDYSEMDVFRAKVEAVSETYGVSTDAMVEASNKLARDMGIAYEDAAEMISKGLAVSTNRDEFLEQLKEYPAYAREAGMSVDDLFTLIASSQQQGIFSDKAIDSVKEGNLRLREMTKATKEALDGIGLNSDEISKELESGMTTTWEVMKKVSDKLGELPESSAEVGTAIADIFGGPGEDAGLKFLQTLGEIGGSMDDLLARSPDHVKAIEEKRQSTERLKKAVADFFGFSSGGWDTMLQSWETSWNNTLTRLMLNLDWLKTGFDGLWEAGKRLAHLDFSGAKEAWDAASGDMSKIWQQIEAIRDGKPIPEFSGGKHNADGVAANVELGEVTVTGNKNKVKTKKAGTAGGKAGTKKGRVTSGRTTEKTEEQINNDKIQKLTSEYIKASEDRQAAIREEIKILKERNEQIALMKKDAAGGNATVAENKIIGDKSAPSVGLTGLNDGMQLDFGNGPEIIGTILSPLQELEAEADILREKMEMAASPEVWAALASQLEGVDGKIKAFKGESQGVSDSGKGASESWKAAVGSISQVGGALQQIEDPAAKVAGIVMQALATLALTMAESLKDTPGVWTWIAGAAAGTATLISTIAAVKSAVGSYAEGGIIPGNDYHDGLTANVSSGELILNRAQQGNLASQLGEGGGVLGGLRLETTVKGEDLRIALNRNGRRKGKGELAFGS